MDLSEEISKLVEEQSINVEIYQVIFKKLLNNKNKIETKDLEILYLRILKDVKDGSVELQELFLNNLLVLCQNEDLRKLLSEDLKENILKGILFLISSKEKKILNLCFCFLSENFNFFKLTNNLAEDLLGKVAELLSKNNLSVSLYLSVTSYIQRFMKEFEGKLSSFMHIIPKLIFLPLIHSSANVREVAEKTLNDFPKPILYSEDESFCNVLLKLIKEEYCKDLLSLFKGKQELYVLKIWKHVVNSLGKTLHSNITAMTPFFQVIEKGFKSTSDEVCKMSFIIWKCLISNFASDEAVLNDSKKLRFILKPFRNISRSNENISLVVCDTWWHLAWSLSHNLSLRFSEVCIPMLEFVIGKTVSGPYEKTVPKICQEVLIRRGCHLLLRLLEQPSTIMLSKITSPKKYPPIFYPALQVPLDPKVLICYFKEICSVIKSVVEVLGDAKDMYNHIECLMKSMLSITFLSLDDKNKNIEVVTSALNLVTDIIESQMCSPLLCLKCIDSLSKLPRSSLTSHCYNGGSHKPQDILCSTLLKLLLNSYLLTKDTPKRFLATYNRLVQAGLCESLNPFLMAQRFIHCLKVAAAPGTMNADILFDMWSGIASPLLEIIEKNQEVNQGDKREHDFTCMYDVLLCPFEHIFPNMNQRTKPSLQLWANLYKTFIRCASLVPTTLPNECCEELCLRLKGILKIEVLMEPYYFENMCFFLEVVLESIDSASVLAAYAIGSLNPSLMIKQKKPLGNLTSVVNILSVILKVFYDDYLNSEDIYQSCTPKAQKKCQIIKTAIPVDLMNTLCTNIMSGSMIPLALKELAEPMSKIFLISQKKNSSNQISSKLENFWNKLSSSVEMHYRGPYDNEFLLIMSPLLEASFCHSRRLIKERCRRFWLATFAPVSSTLKYPDSLRICLKKAKVIFFPSESVSSLEDISCLADSTSLEDDVNFSNIDLKDSFAKPVQVTTPVKSGKKELNCSALKDTPKDLNSCKQSKTVEVKSSPKRNIDELSSSEFVKIESPVSINTTPRRRSIRKRKSFVPALYNDLSQSQDTNTLFGGSSDSKDLTSSSEIEECSSQLETNKPVRASQQICAEQMDQSGSAKNANIVELIEECSKNETTTNKKIKRDSSVLDFKPVNKQNLISLTGSGGNGTILLENRNNLVNYLTEKEEVISDSCADKLSQTSVVIALADSNKVVPSSHNSEENDVFEKYSACENIKESYCNKSLRKASNINSSKASSVFKISRGSTAPKSLNDEHACLIESNNEIDCIHECPETSADFIKSNPKILDSIVSNPESLHVETSMPLKSLENIQSADEHIVISENLTNKCSASNISSWIDKTEEQTTVTENKPSFDKNELSIQTSNEVLPEEEKILQQLEKINSNSELTLASLNKKEGASTALSKTSVKNLRKNLGRKSLDVVCQNISMQIRTRSSGAITNGTKKDKNSTTVNAIDNNLEESDFKSICAEEILKDKKEDHSLLLSVKKDITSEIKTLRENMFDLNSKESNSNENECCKKISNFLLESDIIATQTKKVALKKSIQIDLSTDISCAFDQSFENVNGSNLIISNENNKTKNTNSDIFASSLNVHEENDKAIDLKEHNSFLNNECDDKIEIVAVVSSICPTASQNVNDTSENYPLKKRSKPRKSKLARAKDSILIANSQKCIEDQESKHEDSNKNALDYVSNNDNSQKSSNSLSDVKTNVIEVDLESSEKLGDVQSNPNSISSLKVDTRLETLESSKELHDSFPNISNPQSNDTPTDNSNFEIIKGNMYHVENILEQKEGNPDTNLNILTTKLSLQENDTQPAIEDLFFTNLNSSNTVEITEANNQVVNNVEISEIDSPKITETNCSKTTYQQFVTVDVDVMSVVNELLCRIDAIICNDSKFSDSQNTPDFFKPDKIHLISSFDSDIKDDAKTLNPIVTSLNLPVVTSLDLPGCKLPLSNKVNCFPVTSVEKMSSKSTSNKQNDFKEKQGTSKKRKAKSPKRFYENNNIKTCLISSQVLDKTGLEIKKTDSYHSLKNTKISRNELTEINTHFNASSCTATRRYKMLAASQQSFKAMKQSDGLPYFIPNEFPPECEEAGKSSSILKKRKASDDSSTIKVRKVTFADPLVEEKLFQIGSICTNSLNQTSEVNEKSIEIKIDNISLPEITKTTNSSVLTPISLENMPSSCEYQNSDILTSYNATPVSPALINCKDSLNNILKDLTSPAWIRALETLLLSRNITTIGDLCKLNIHELNVLPIKSPKLQSLHKALFSHLARTQTEVAEKNIEVDYIYSETSHSAKDFSSTSSADDSDIVPITDENKVSEMCARFAEGLLENDNIKLVPKNTLIALSKKCINEVAERLENA